MYAREILQENQWCNKAGDKMNFVEPIRDKQKVRDIQDYLKQTNPRNYIMFITGVYTGLRISDILKLKVKDVKNKEGIYLREKRLVNKIL